MRKLINPLIAAVCVCVDYLIGNEVDLTQAWIVPVIAGASALIGALQRNAANRMENQNPFPNAAANPNILQNVATAEQMAQTGLPGAQYSLAQQGLQRNLGGVLRQAQSMRGYGVNLPSILRQSNQAQAQLDASNSAARVANQRLLMQARTQLAGEENRVWGWNEQQRYTDIANRLASLRSAGNQNIAGSLGFLGQLYASGAWGGFGGNNTQSPGGQSQNNYNSLFGAPLGYSMGSGYGMAPQIGTNA